jgi:thiamine-phosphate pyrophosphorylase
LSRASWLYAIVDLDACARYDVAPRDHADRCLAFGARWLQLRAKDGDDGAHRRLADALAARCAAEGATFVVNDRVALARAVGAPCVHVGQGDLSAERIRSVAPGLAFGRSTHGAREVDAAIAEGPAYVAFGPIFGTASKRNPEPAVGLAALAAAHAKARAAGLPLVAIGGVDGSTLEAVRAACDAVALISALLPHGGEAPDAPFARLGLTR